MAARLAYCVSRILFRMSLAMVVHCAMYSVSQSHAICDTCAFVGVLTK